MKIQEPFFFFFPFLPNHGMTSFFEGASSLEPFGAMKALNLTKELGERKKGRDFERKEEDLRKNG